MNEADSPHTIGPDAYTSWCATTLGLVTEALEHRLILNLMGELPGDRVLDDLWAAEH